MSKVTKNFDTIIQRYREEVRSWTRSWLEHNLTKPVPRWDENGNLTSNRDEGFDIWAPKETILEFSHEIAHDHIIPLILEDLEKQGSNEEWEDLLLPSEDSSQDYIFPILMKAFRDEAYQYLEKMHFVLREIDRDLLGYPKANFAANRILSAIIDEIEDEISEDHFATEALRKLKNDPQKAAKPITKKKTTAKTIANAKTKVKAKVKTKAKRKPAKK